MQHCRRAIELLLSGGAAGNLEMYAAERAVWEVTGVFALSERRRACRDEHAQSAQQD
jgi:hypothetical protein